MSCGFRKCLDRKENFGFVAYVMCPSHEDGGGYVPGAGASFGRFSGGRVDVPNPYRGAAA
jgi:hypothetical protein